MHSLVETEFHLFVNQPLNFLADATDSCLTGMKPPLTDGLLQGVELVPTGFDPGQTLVNQVVKCPGGYSNPDVQISVWCCRSSPATPMHEDVIAKYAGPASFLFEAFPKSGRNLLELLFGHPLRRPLFRKDSVVVVAGLSRFSDCLGQGVRTFVDKDRTSGKHTGPGKSSMKQKLTVVGSTLVESSVF